MAELDNQRNALRAWAVTAGRSRRSSVRVLEVRRRRCLRGRRQVRHLLGGQATTCSGPASSMTGTLPTRRFMRRVAFPGSVFRNAFRHWQDAGLPARSAESMNYDRRQRKPSFLALCGGLLAAAAVGLSAYASHGVGDGQAQSEPADGGTVRLRAWPGAGGTGRRDRVAHGQGRPVPAVAGHAAVRKGSLVAGAMVGTSTRLAPAGGIMLMLGWVLWASTPSALTCPGTRAASIPNRPGTT